MAEFTVVALTPRGLDLGQRMTRALARGEVRDARAAVRETLVDLFQSGRPLVCVMALGIVVRILGPLARDKQSDPPVVVVDEAGRFAISVLGGHAGGANALAADVAKAIGATPVITTASEALGLPAIDQIGQEWGWKIERPEDLKALAAAVIRGENIAVYQQAGRRLWADDWPQGFQLVKSWPQGGWSGLIAISDLRQPAASCPTVIYRPPSLVLGVGCKRGVPWEEIGRLFEHLCQARGFSPLSLGLVATASLKADEPGLVEFARRRAVPLVCFSVEELNQVADIPSPSETVRAKIGTAGVAEPAALLAAKARHLLMNKHKGEGITMALARREDA